MTGALEIEAQCIPCQLRQAVDLLARAGATTAQAESVLRSVLAYLANVDFALPAPVHTGHSAHLVAEVTGVSDPFSEAKKAANDLALEMLPRLRRMCDDSADRWETAVRLAVAGNVIDLGPKSHVSMAEVLSSVEDAAALPMPKDRFQALKKAVSRADRILYLADNAGEIVFDTLLLDQLPLDRVTFAVRGQPVINDAVLTDAEYAGITELVRVIDNGSRIPGTWLPACSAEFVGEFNRADLIISKGQGNYETLLGMCEHPIFFLFKVKCNAVSRWCGLPLGSMVIHRI